MAPKSSEIGQHSWWEDRASHYYESMDISTPVKDYVTQRRADLAGAHLREGEKFLDLGVGTGTIFQRILHSARPEAVGMDYTRNMVEVARRQPGNDAASFLQADGIRLPFQSRTFDLVFTVDVMHHIAFEGLQYVNQALSEIKRVLQDGGRLVIYEANPLNPYWYYYMLKIGEDNARLMRMGSLQRRLRQCGLEVTDSSYIGFVPEFLSEKALNRFRRVEAKVESSRIFNKLCSNYYVVANKPLPLESTPAEKEKRSSRTSAPGCYAA